MEELHGKGQLTFNIPLLEVIYTVNYLKMCQLNLRLKHMGTGGESQLPSGRSISRICTNSVSFYDDSNSKCGRILYVQNPWLGFLLNFPLKLFPACTNDDRFLSFSNILEL